MKICENLITDYFSANFTEDEPLWDVNKVDGYNNGDEAREEHYIYKYAGISGTNTLTLPSLNPDKWLKTRASNYYAMLGDRTDEQTTTSGNLIIEIDISNYDTLTLLNMTGTQIDIEVTDLDTMDIVYTDSKNLQDTTEIIDAYTHYFSPFVYVKSYYNNMIPLVGNARIKIEITALSGTAGIGRLVCGQSYYVGDTLFGTSQNLESYSRIEFDEFGTATLVPRSAVYNSSHSIRIPSSKVDALKEKRKSLDAIPILFIGNEEIDSRLGNLLSYGLWQNADMLISRPTFSDMSMTIKELL